MFKLREMRERAGLSQQEAAMAVGRTPACLSNWERGYREPGLNEACLLADAYHCSLDELAGHETNREQRSISRDELQLISDYRSTDDRGRRNIAAIAAAQRGDARLLSTIDEVAQ